MRDNVYRHNRNRLGREERILLSIQIMPATSILSFQETGRVLSLELRFQLIVDWCSHQMQNIQSQLHC